MAFGDALTERRQSLIATDFTPQLKEAGVELIPGGATTDVAFEGRLGEVLVQGQNQRQAVSPLSPENVRAPNPLAPNQLAVPEDDALTPEGVLAPSEIKETGSFFQKVGDVLSNPASVKLLANLGIAIGRGTNAGSNIGEYAIANAEETAKQQLRDRVNAGENAGDVLIRGLSGQGRQEVLKEFQDAQTRETEAARAERAEGRADKALENDTANTQSLIESRDASTEFQGKQLELREQELELQRQSTEVLNDLRKAETNLTKARAKDANVTPDEDTIAKASAATRLASDYDGTIEGEQEVLTNLQNQLRRVQSSGRRGRDQIAPLQEKITEQEQRIQNLRTVQGSLRSTASGLLGAPVPVNSEEEAKFLPPGTLIILNGRKAVTE